MATREFRLPDPGEGLVEAEIVTWRVGVGDPVEINDILLEVETSKSLVELPSPYGGTVAELLAAEGEMVDVGAPIIRITDAAEESEAPAVAGGGAPEDLIPALPVEAPAPVGVGAGGVGAGGVGTAGVGTGDAGAGDGVTGASGRVPVLVGYGPRTTQAKRRPRKVQTPDPMGEQAQAHLAATFSTAAPVSRRVDEREPLPAHQAEPVGDPLPGTGALRQAQGASSGQAHGATVLPAGAPLAKPPVRKLAKDLGVDLTTLTGSGPGGVITRADVEAAGEGPRPELGQAVRQTQPAFPGQPASGAQRNGTDTRVPIRGVRRATAEAMVASAFTAPHVTEWLTCDVTSAMELLDRLRDRREFAEVKVSPLLLVAKAVCLALRRTPELNSTWDGAAGEIVLHGAVNLGIAAATPRGLLVPNLKGADRLSLAELATGIGTLVATAREGKTPPADLAQGTFTITNVGVFGIDAGTPILNPGEAGILCVGAVTRRPWVVGSGASERIEPRWVTTLALSFDHRLADGEQGSRFLADVASLLCDPGLALVF